MAFKVAVPDVGADQVASGPALDWTEVKPQDKTLLHQVQSCGYDSACCLFLTCVDLTQHPTLRQACKLGL